MANAQAADAELEVLVAQRDDLLLYYSRSVVVQAYVANLVRDVPAGQDRGADQESVEHGGCPGGTPCMGVWQRRRRLDLDRAQEILMFREVVIVCQTD